MKYFYSTIILLATVFFSHTAFSQDRFYTTANIEKWFSEIEFENKVDYMKKLGFDYDRKESGAYFFSNRLNHFLSIDFLNKQKLMLTILAGTGTWQDIVTNIDADKKWIAGNDMTETIDGKDVPVKNWTKGKYLMLALRGNHTIMIGENEDYTGDENENVATPIPSAPPARSKKLISAGQIATELNEIIDRAELSEDIDHGMSHPFKFALLGGTDFSQSSIEFFQRQGKLYIRMHLPPQGDCQSGLKEFPAILCCQRGGDASAFEFYFTYTRSCQGKRYKSLSCNFKTKESWLYEAVFDWLNANGQSQW